MESAIFSALLAILALSNAAFRPQNNNVEVCYCVEPSAAPGRGEEACFPTGKLRHGAKTCVGAAYKPSPCPTVLPSLGRLRGHSPMPAPTAGGDGGREGGRDATTPTPHSPPHCRDCGSPLRSSSHSPTLGIIHLDATRCRWPGTNDTSVMGFRKGRDGEEGHEGTKTNLSAGKMTPLNI